jgi:hypothetical protein
MLKITDENYEDYKKVSEILWKFIAAANDIDPNSEYSPMVVLADWEKKSKSLAKKGLKSGLIDEITMAMGMPFDVKKQIDEQLSVEGFLTFNQLILTVQDTLQKALKRGKIRNLDEYYLLKELLDSSESDISEVEKRKVEEMLAEFEIDYGKKEKG